MFWPILGILRGKFFIFDEFLRFNPKSPSLNNAFDG